jgi:hypothetical protein
MSDEHSKTNQWRWGPAALCLLLAVYVGGYFAMGDCRRFPDRSVFRHYRSYPVASMFAPLAWLECKIRQRSVYLGPIGSTASTELSFEP